LANTRQARAHKRSRIAVGIIVTVLSLFGFLCNVRAFGFVGSAVAHFLVGFLGLASYAYTLVGIVLGIAITFGVSPKMRLRRAAFYIGMFSLAVFALHVYTSSGHIINADYGTYLSTCYNATNTAGGVLYGLTAFPLMKVLTSVGALTVGCFGFFLMLFFALFPTIRKNVTYTAPSRRSRVSASSNSGETVERRSLFARTKKQNNQHNITEPATPVLTDLSNLDQGENALYVVDVPGDPMPKKRTLFKRKGAEGYQPLNSFNPLYPNQNGRVEDEQMIPRSMPGGNTPLFGDRPNMQVGPSVDENAGYGTPQQNAAFSAARRSELSSRLGIEETRDTVREEYIARHRAPKLDGGYYMAEPQRPANAPNANSNPNGQNFADSQRPVYADQRTAYADPRNAYQQPASPLPVNSGVIDFNALKEEQDRAFARAPMQVMPQFEAEATAFPTTDDYVQAPPVRREVVKPSRNLPRSPYSNKDDVNPTVRRAESAVQGVNVGMLGALNRSANGSPRPENVRDNTELFSEAYQKPVNAANAASANRQQNAPLRPTANVDGENQQNVAGVKPQENKPIVNTEISGLSSDSRSGLSSASRNGQASALRNRQTAASETVIRNGQPSNIGEVENNGYPKAQSRMPRAFEATSVGNDVRNNEQNDGKQSSLQSALRNSAGMDRDNNARENSDNRDPEREARIRESLRNNEMKKPNLERQAAPEHSSAVGGETPSEPAPIRQQVTGGDMSRAAIQGATDIAGLSGKDKENAEIEARIQNIRRSSQSAPVVQYDRDSKLQEAKVRSSRSRGINESEAKPETRVSQVSIEQIEAQMRPKSPYSPPPLNLLNPPAPDVDQNEDYEEKKEKIINTLEFFKISGEVIEIKVGPTFTMYKLKVEMPRGRTINYISTLENDIAMRMQVGSVRIIAPIPGQDAVGIEVPNKFRRNVNLSEIVNSPEFNQSTDTSTFALGKNLYGKSIVARISKLPHAIIAGATGAGKSCCINSLIISLLYKASPDDVRLILVDPKRVELSVYEGIPHLLMDEIICDTDKAIRALNWAIQEMERRTKLFSDGKFRDIDEYNAYSVKHNLEKLPRIVIIVDEFADLMATGKKSVEDTVDRLARLARALGINLILATQRPSVDVISGTIKNNFPSRIAFKVTSSFDSKTILDGVGAEKLLGYGDMLYMKTGTTELERVQGAFISNEEVAKIVDYVKKHNESYFDEKIKDAIFKDPEPEAQQAKGKDKAEGGLPPELFKVLELGIKLREDNNQPLSITYIQRKLGLGYPKASKIADMIDDLGYFTTDPTTKKRIVNITWEELEELRNSMESGDDEE